MKDVVKLGPNFSGLSMTQLMYNQLHSVISNGDINLTVRRLLLLSVVRPSLLTYLHMEIHVHSALAHIGKKER